MASVFACVARDPYDMAVTSRQFIALSLPESALSELHSRQERLQQAVPDLRLTPREQLHVTLVFLGNMEAGSTPTVAECMQAACGQLRDLRLFTTEPALFGAGRVIAYDIDGPEVERVREARETLVTSLCEAGLHQPEPRTWRPHVSIARLRQPPELPIAELVGESPEVEFVCSELVLYASVAQPAGHRHEPVFQIPLT